MSDYPPPNRRPDGFNDEDLYKPFQWVALPPGEPERADACTWTYDDWHGYYDTTCGDAFWLAEEWTEKFKFCPYCGNRISLAEKGGAE